MLALINFCDTVMDDHICPYFIHIHAIGIIKHICRKSAAGTHVHFQGNNIPLLPKTVLIL